MYKKKIKFYYLLEASALIPA